MTTIQIRQTQPAFRGTGLCPELAAMDDFPCRTTRERLDSRQFDAMSHAFRPHGGFAASDDVMRRLRPLSDQPLSMLARWIVSRTVLSVSWRDQSLLPMFQFDLADMSIKPACARVVAELKDVFDDWELALWFAAPNVWLDHAAPVALLADEEFAVLQAARADRFVARG